MLLQREQLRDPHRSRPAHPRQVVPQQVDDHHVLGPILVALRERPAEGGVVHRAEPAGAGALDGPGLDVPAVLVEAEEPLGRRAQDRDVAEVEVGGERRRIPAAAAFDIDRKAARRSGAWNRWERLAWKMSPATMYSRTRATASRYPRWVKVERSPIRSAFSMPMHRVRGRRRAVAGTRARPASGCRGCGRGPDRAAARCTIASRSAARRSAPGPVSGMPVETTHAVPSRWSQAITQSYSPSMTSGMARSS